ncbi:MAG: hypothetical protein KC912_23955 [Proteobacteria bacterium]|nr:hypothetical protein [Pseudomonadota bacterium]
MWRSVVGVLAVSASAFAADPVEVPLPVPATAIVADAEALLAIGPEGGLVMVLESMEKRPVELSAVAATLADIDGKPGPELVVCGDAGVAVLEWPSRAAIVERAGACAALAVGRDADGPVILAVGAKLSVLRFEAGGLKQLASAEAPEGTPVVAAGGDRFVVGTVGGDTLVERSAWGESTIATGGALGGVAYRDGLWLWSLTDQDTLMGQLKEELLTGRGPGLLQVADLNGDGVDDVVVQHADRVGIVQSSSEEMIPWRGPVSAVAVDRQACPTVWVASEGLLRGFEQDCVTQAPPVAAAVSPPPVQEQVIQLDGRAIPELVATVGVPMKARLVDIEGRPFTYSARGGPRGMVVYSDGLVQYTPQAGQQGDYMLDVRMSAGLNQRGSRVRLHVRSSSSPPTPAPPVEPSPPVPTNADGLDYRYVPRRSGMLRRCSMVGGVAAAVSRSPQNTWEFVGRGPWTGSISPMFAAACEGKGTAVRWFGRASTAPFLFYALPDGFLGMHVLAASFGASFGSEVLRAGVYLRMGILVAGPGVRATFLPFKARKGDRRHGFELDVIGYMPSSPAGGASLSYMVTL